LPLAQVISAETKPGTVETMYGCTNKMDYVTTDQCTGFMWQGFGSRGTTGATSVRSCQKLPLCPMEPVPAGSKTDLPLPKAKPISDSGSAPVIT